MSHWTAAPSAKWSCGRPSSSLVWEQLPTIWNIVWHLPHGCKAPLFVAGCAVTLVSLKMVYFWPVSSWQMEYWLLDSGSYTRKELTTKTTILASNIPRMSSGSCSLIFSACYNCKLSDHVKFWPHLSLPGNWQLQFACVICTSSFRGLITVNIVHSILMILQYTTKQH